MRIRRFAVLLLCVLAAAGLLSTAAAAQFAGSSADETVGETTAVAAGRPTVTMISQAEGSHVNYMNGDSQGLFWPEKELTRAELAQILYGIVVDRPAVKPVFQDVARDAWYAPAVETVAGLGLMLGDYSTFRPEDPATRAECAYALALLLPSDAPLLDVFTDVWPGYWAYQAICRTAGQGLFFGDGAGQFRPEDGLRRGEAVAVFNRLLGRSPDLETLMARSDLHTFPDVPRTHWAYGEIMEATVTHQYAAVWNGEHWVSAEAGVSEAEEPPAVETPPSEAAGLPDGPQRIDGHLYWVVDGKFARGHGMEGLYFNENGWYTTGNEALDELLNDIVDRVTNESMTRDEKLRALFDYVVKNYTYLARPMVSKGTTGWEPEYAKFFLQNGKGNCFSFAAAYCLLCQELGLPAYTVVGASGNASSPHGWVEISLDGSTYMFDPELQWYYNNRTSKSYNLFKMLPDKVPSGVYRYIR